MIPSPASTTRPLRQVVLGAAVALFLALPAAAAAQACTGWGTQPGQYAIGAGITSYSNATEYRVETQANLPGALASGVYLGAVDLDGIDENAFVVGGRLTYDIPRDAYWLCPLAGLRYERLSDEFEGLTESISSLLVPLGLGVGTMLPAGDSAILLPYLQGGLMYGRVSASVDGSLNGNGVGFAGSDSDVGYFVQIGTGVDFGRFGIRGAWERIDVDGGENNLQLSLAVLF